MGLKESLEAAKNKFEKSEEEIIQNYLAMVMDCINCQIFTDAELLYKTICDKVANGIISSNDNNRHIEGYIDFPTCSNIEIPNGPAYHDLYYTLAYRYKDGHVFGKLIDAIHQQIPSFNRHMSNDELLNTFFYVLYTKGTSFWSSCDYIALSSYGKRLIQLVTEKAKNDNIAIGNVMCEAYITSHGRTKRRKQFRLDNSQHHPLDRSLSGYKVTLAYSYNHSR